MQVHAQSSMTLAESRPPYIHLGYISASSGGSMPSVDFDFLAPGAFFFMLAYLIVLKLNYGWLIGGVAGLFRKFGVFKILGLLLSFLLILVIVFAYCFLWMFN